MDFLTNPFTTALLFLYQFLGQNIVLTIVVFTVLTRLLTFPLTQQQIKSSKGMQAIQPHMKKLQEKYKNDREKLASDATAFSRASRRPTRPTRARRAARVSASRSANA